MIDPLAVKRPLGHDISRAAHTVRTPEDRKLFDLLPTALRVDMATLMGEILSVCRTPELGPALDRFNRAKANRALKAYFEEQGIKGLLLKRPDPHHPSRLDLVVHHRLLMDELVRRYLRTGRLIAMAGLHVQRVRFVFGDRELSNRFGFTLFTADTSGYVYVPRRRHQAYLRSAIESAQRGDPRALRSILDRHPDVQERIQSIGLPYTWDDGGMGLTLRKVVEPVQDRRVRIVKTVSAQGNDDLAVDPAKRLAEHMLQELVQELDRAVRDAGGVFVLKRHEGGRLLDLVIHNRDMLFVVLGARGVICPRLSANQVTLCRIESLEDLGQAGVKLVHFIQREVLEDMTQSGFLEDADLIGLLSNTGGLVDFLRENLDLEVVIPPVAKGELAPNVWVFKRTQADRDEWRPFWNP
jgi:hypothetical protein